MVNMATAAPGQTKPFNLLRRFGVASLLIIVAIALANGALLSNFVTERLLEREAQVTKDFVLNVLHSDGSLGYLSDQGNEQLAARFAGSVVHFKSIPDIQRINVYGRDRTVLWSTDSQLVGQSFDQNKELEEALRGALVVESGSISDNDRVKTEHVGLHALSSFFVETYIPIQAPGESDVLGVFELYKAPVALTKVIRDGQRQIWLTAALGAFALHLTLFWIVRSAHRKIIDQHQRLMKAETMAAVGELASSVAHNIRNPLASIRSSAEVALELGESPSSEQAHDIMAGVDRIEGWLRDMVGFAHVDAAAMVPIDVSQLLRTCFDASGREFERAHLSGEVHAELSQCRVMADPALLGHVLQSLVSNAIEATAAGGHITGRVTRMKGNVEIRIADTGRGMTPEQLAQLFGLFFTTKPRGLGIGLTLAHRAVERFGGTIGAESTPGVGTVFTITLPEA
jgi:two-component system, NtrC family, sensor histidine kinase HydH